jgi:uncharacterized membrane protein HdeD (DUF308 family)
MANAVVVALGGKAVNELWWLWALQATLALFFGIVAVFWPGLTLITLVYLFSAFILGLGIVEVINGLISIRRRGSWWITLLIGIAGVGVGIYLVRHTDISLRAFIITISILLFVRGILDIMRAFVDDLPVASRALLTLVGVTALIAGIFIISRPLTGGVAFVWILGLYSLIAGAFGMAMAFQLREAFNNQTAEEEKVSSSNDQAAKRRIGARAA